MCSPNSILSNIMFQSDSVPITALGSECERLLRIIGSKFLKLDKINGENIFNCDPKHPENLLELEKVKIGTATQKVLNEISDSAKYVKSDIK